MKEKETSDKPVRVRATRAGFYGHGMAGSRIRKGTRFTIQEKDFSEKWMERIADDEPDDLAALRETAPHKPTRRNPDAKEPEPSKSDAKAPTGSRNVLG